MDDAINNIHLATPVSCHQSRSSKGSVFGSIERMFNILTPRKQRDSSADGPRKVKVSGSGLLI